MQVAKARACIGEEARSAAFIRDRALIFIVYLEISEVIKAPTVELVKFAHLNYDIVIISQSRKKVLSN